MLGDLKMVWYARCWMKKNETFLPTWHAYVGYKLDLFAKLAGGKTATECLALCEGHQEVLSSWLDAGLELGHLQKTRKGLILPKKEMLTYFTRSSPFCIGELLREMLEMHIPALLSYPKLLQGEEKNMYYGDTYGQTVAATSALIEKRAFPIVYKWLKRNKADRVLDIGCGNGGYLIRLAEKLQKGHFIGIDINEEVISHAQQVIQEKRMPHVEVHHTRMEEWTGPPQPVQMVMMNNILHYYSPKDRAELLQKTASFLEKNGTLTIITPLYLERGGRLFSTAFNSFMSAYENLYSLPRKKELILDAKRAGFSCRSVKTVVREGSWYFIAFEKK